MIDMATPSSTDIIEGDEWRVLSHLIAAEHLMSDIATDGAVDAERAPAAGRPSTMSELELVLIPELGEILTRRLRSIEDEPAYTRFGRALAQDDLRMRLAGPACWSSALVPRLFGFGGTAFAALDDRGEIVGVGGIVGKEISLIVRSAVKRHGLGRVLLGHIVGHALEHGFSELTGSVLAEDRPMLQLASGKRHCRCHDPCRAPLLYYPESAEGEAASLPRCRSCLSISVRGGFLCRSAEVSVPRSLTLLVR
jgi:GNAT superfamily N-acetyltransferase